MVMMINMQTCHQICSIEFQTIYFEFYCKLDKHSFNNFLVNLLMLSKSNTLGHMHKQGKEESNNNL
jgi:hypothetical protein